MSGCLNKVTLIGNLGRDPEVRHSQDGTKIITMNIATSEKWKDKTSNEPKEKTEWHRVVIFNPNLADVAEKYIKKGAKVYIEGTLQTRKWTDTNSGQEKYTTEIILSRFRGTLIMLDSLSEDGNAYEGSAPPASPPNPPDDDIPF